MFKNLTVIVHNLTVAVDEECEGTHARTHIQTQLYQPRGAVMIIWNTRGDPKITGI